MKQRVFANVVMAFMLTASTFTYAGSILNRDLTFIKTANTPNGHVEIHTASATSNYQTRTLELWTTFTNETDGTWQILSNNDLAFIKTANTAHGYVEVHIASAASNYQTRILDVETTFTNETGGTWQILDNNDLAFIKTANTPNGHIEVHIASATSNYQTRKLDVATTFTNETDGTWRILNNYDLAFIKTANTTNGHVEVHIASASSNYQTRTLAVATPFTNETDGIWQILGNNDLAFIKTANTPNHHIEVHIVSAASKYKTHILDTATTFTNETDGTWMINEKMGAWQPSEQNGLPWWQFSDSNLTTFFIDIIPFFVGLF
ncbi:hypothetical protein [Methylovulum psychrotolerans]|uniref:Uncharacterized protein n=1 Tax=Methylovulum psychrotolerans TaxID=1704499 RepID=A0A1Z4C1Y6_9GAMM|nr:hypothetical protein [Methylovulum psychrotolerans]ASF47524.1 hypothetical protein CEK71_16450 [Methylovulum psychrotolerans]